VQRIFNAANLGDFGNAASKWCGNLAVSEREFSRGGAEDFWYWIFTADYLIAAIVSKYFC